MHGQLLQFYLDRNMKLVRVHRAIRFTASPYFEPYINNNTQKRLQCKRDKVARNFYKLMNNAPYSKTIENVAKQSDIRLVMEKDAARLPAEKPHCLDFQIFDENLIGVEMRKLQHVILGHVSTGAVYLSGKSYICTLSTRYSKTHSTTESLCSTPTRTRFSFICC